MTPHETAIQALEKVEPLAKTHSWLIAYAILAAGAAVCNAIEEASQDQHITNHY